MALCVFGHQALEGKIVKKIVQKVLLEKVKSHALNTFLAWCAPGKYFGSSEGILPVLPTFLNYAHLRKVDIYNLNLIITSS